MNLVGAAYPYQERVRAASAYTEGIHTVESWLKETTATAKVTVEKPIVTNMSASTDGRPSGSTRRGIPNCYYNVNVNFSVFVSDPYGSGVAATPTAVWTNPDTVTATIAEGHRLAWDWYTWEVTGTVKAPLPSAPVTSVPITWTAYDLVGNGGPVQDAILFDVVPAHHVLHHHAGARRHADRLDEQGRHAHLQGR